MIYLTFALYAEAAPFIQALQLKRQENHTRFQLFTSDTHRLIVTGPGSLNAAMANTWLLTQYPPNTAQDCFAQIGTCGAPSSFPAGNLYLCHKISDFVTGRSRYPDMIYHSDFEESALITYPGVCQEPPEETLVDMEGYGGMEAASLFFPLHRIFTWKVVSDHGAPNLKPSDLTALLEPHAAKILNWLHTLPPDESGNERTLSDSMAEFQSQLVTRFGYSAALQLQLHNLLYYAQLSQITTDQLATLLPDQDTGKPAQKKLEGKRFLHELEQRILP